MEKSLLDRLDALWDKAAAWFHNNPLKAAFVGGFVCGIGVSVLAVWIV